MVAANGLVNSQTPVTFQVEIILEHFPIPINLSSSQSKEWKAARSTLPQASHKRAATYQVLNRSNQGNLQSMEKLPTKPNTSKAVTAIKIKNTLFFITGKAPWPITYLQQKHPKGNGINTVHFHIQLCFPYPPPVLATLNILEGAGQ